MKSLENYILENRDSFDTREPAAGHLHRFERRMKAQNRPVLSRYLVPAMKVAAIFVLALFSSLWLIDNFFSPSLTPQGVSLSDVSPELMEVEVFYTSLIDEQYSQIKAIDLSSEDAHKEIMLRELEEMNSVYKTLQEDLKSNPHNERIIHAMIQYYQMKTDVMAQILEQLKELEANKPKSNDDENIEI